MNRLCIKSECVAVRLCVCCVCCVLCVCVCFFLMIRRPPRSTLDRSSAASDVYKRQAERCGGVGDRGVAWRRQRHRARIGGGRRNGDRHLSLIHISEPTRPY